MKPYLLIAALFVATTTWAFPIFPWVFFAKFNNTYIPLSGKYFGERFGHRSMFTYGNPSVRPVEFTFKDNYAYTTRETGSQYVGLHQDELMFGRAISPEPLDLDKKWRSQSGPFYLCDMMGGPERWILHRTVAQGITYCFEVDIYFLPYNRRNNSAVYPDANGKFRWKSEDSSQVGAKPCSIYYYGRNALRELAQDEGSFDESCEVYIDGEPLPRDKNSSVQSKTPCSMHYYGTHARKELAEYVLNYNGECDIYINWKLMPKSEKDLVYGSRNSCAHHFLKQNVLDKHVQFTMIGNMTSSLRRRADL